METLTITEQSVLTRNQKKVFGPKLIDGGKRKIWAKVRFDDECKNGHNTFAITGTTRRLEHGRFVEDSCGCIHDQIAEYFPELEKYIKFHLCSTDGPMHYVANTVFHASNRDCWGKLHREPKSFETVIHFGANPIKHKFGRKFTAFLEAAAPHPGADRFDFEVLPIEHGPDTSKSDYKFKPKYTFGGFADKWHECPFDTEQEALDFLYALQHCEPTFVKTATAWGDGKERDLNAARHCAIWPEATDEQLMASKEELTAALEARLPALLRDFRRHVEELGFTW